MLCLLPLVLTGCSTTLDFRYQAMPPASLLNATGYTIAIKDVKDSRPELAIQGRDKRSIGKLAENVPDLYSNEIILRKDIADVVKQAVDTELKLNGFKIASPDEADALISADIKEFRLDIESRDEVSILIELTITQRSNGNILWSGIASQKTSRFAGVFGNSSSDISAYLSSSMSKAIRSSLVEGAPYLSAAFGNRNPLRDINTGAGRLMVRSIPPGARLYVNGVYYGLTPLTVSIESGIVDMSLKKDGYLEFKEKVSIRNAETTEADFRLEKEEKN